MYDNSIMSDGVGLMGGAYFCDKKPSLAVAPSRQRKIKKGQRKDMTIKQKRDLRSHIETETLEYLKSGKTISKIDDVIKERVYAPSNLSTHIQPPLIEASVTHPQGMTRFYLSSYITTKACFNRSARKIAVYQEGDFLVINGDKATWGNIPRGYTVLTLRMSSESRKDISLLPARVVGASKIFNDQFRIGERLKWGNYKCETEVKDLIVRVKLPEVEE